MVPNWRERQKQELRRELYRAAIHLFETKGYEQTTVQQITEQIGVAKGTFFNHFPSKEHVIAQWYDEITERSLRNARAQELSSAEEAVCALFADMSGQATASPELMVAKSQNSAHPLLVAAEQTQVGRMNAFLRECCERGKRSGELPDGLDVDFFVGLLGALLTGTSRGWVLTTPRFDFPALIRERVRFVFRAARRTAPQESDR